MRKAILSGQIYRGKVNYSYSDDGIMDARVNCRKGEELSADELLQIADNLLNNHHYSVDATQNEDGTAEIKLFSCGSFTSSSETLYYDSKRYRYTKAAFGRRLLYNDAKRQN